MKYLQTRNEHYNRFIKENGTDRLSKNLKIYTASKDKLVEIIFNKENINEMYDRVLKTEYKLYTTNSNQHKVIFNTNSGNEYRLDIVPKYELGKGNVWHLAFTDSKIENEEDYDKLLQKNEMIEILNRISYILKDLLEKNIIENNFCIGGTELTEKNNIYEYFLKVMVGKDGFTKETTNLYSVGWGLYFSVDPTKNQEIYKNESW